MNKRIYLSAAHQPGLSDGIRRFCGASIGTVYQCLAYSAFVGRGNLTRFAITLDLVTKGICMVGTDLSI